MESNTLHILLNKTPHGKYWWRWNLGDIARDSDTLHEIEIDTPESPEKLGDDWQEYLERVIDFWCKDKNLENDWTD